MKDQVFKINLDSDVIRRLRNKVNEQQNISYRKTFDFKNKPISAWDKICAIMDRLYDTVDYLNDLELNTGKYSRSAFDFFDFMNNAPVVVDCIKELIKVFNVPYDKVKKSTDIFNQPGNDGKGTDERYFKYLRSLCSVHPVETSRYGGTYHSENNFECSPYVIWNDKRIWNDDCDIYAVVYTNNDENGSKRVQIYISQIFEYVKTRLDFVEEIIQAIDEYQKQVISNFEKKLIKNEEEFNNYADYLRYLDEEQTERYGKEFSDSFDYIINLFEINLSNEYNQSKLNLYLNALKYAIKFEHNRIQNMNSLGFENSGLSYNEKNVETSLYSELCSPRSGSDKERKYTYHWEKINYLSYNSGYDNKQWAYILLEESCKFIEKYVLLEDNYSDFELYTLVQVALYLECLEHNCLINKNIPNSLEYRERLLSDAEKEELFNNN